MDPKADLGGMLCGLVVALPFVLWIGSYVLRVAISLTNSVLGGAVSADLDYYDEPADDRYGRHPQAPTRPGMAIPVPAPGRAMGILFLIGVVDVMVRGGIMVASGAGGGDRMAQAMSALIALPVSFVVQVAMLSSLLPTTLGRAFLVMVFQVLIVVLVCGAIGAAVAICVIGQAGPR